MSDQISRQDAIDTLADMHCKSDEDGYVWIVRSDAWARIDALPSAERKGKWIPSFERWGDILTTVDGYTCSECSVFNTDKDNYCPNCGADMRGEEDE